MGNGEREIFADNSKDYPNSLFVLKAYATMDEATRFSRLLHLNVGPGFEGFSDDYVPGVRVPPARSPRQEEARRNTFWMSYVGERCYARLPGHAMGIDDCDVSQALPLRADSFEEEVGIGIVVVVEFCAKYEVIVSSRSN